MFLDIGIILDLYVFAKANYSTLIPDEYRREQIRLYLE